METITELKTLEAPYIVSISRRTDVPAFYSEWFMNRFRAGFCHVKNPFNAAVYRISLLPKDCFAYFFWSRNLAPLLPFIQEIEASGIHCFFHFTLTPYPECLELHRPDVSDAVRSVETISARLGPERIFWRYDPVILSGPFDLHFHKEHFSRTAKQLSGITRKVIVSFIDYYRKTASNLSAVSGKTGFRFEDPLPQEKKALLETLAETAGEHGMEMLTCCEGEIDAKGVGKGHCIGPEALRDAGLELPRRFRRKPTRKGCGCSESVDIGRYDTCLHGCAYCYATSSTHAGMRYFRNHDPAHPAL